MRYVEGPKVAMMVKADGTAWFSSTKLYAPFAESWHSPTRYELTDCFGRLLVYREQTK